MDMTLTRRVALLAAAAELSVTAAPAHSQQPTPGTTGQAREADHTIPGFVFREGGRMDTRLHYRTLGEPRRRADGQVMNAALLLHGTTGTGAQFLQPSMADHLFGPGQPLDTARWFVVMPDAIGAGGSFKPSDGLRSRFPRFGYLDQVEAQRRLVADALGIAHLRLVLGTSMGGMQAWLWAGLHPGMMDAVVPVACQPAPVSGRNMMWRELILQAIASDPGFHGGGYDVQPTLWAGIWPLFRIQTSNATALEKAAPTRAAAERLSAQLVAEGRGRDANDTHYVFDSSRDYDPGPLLSAITARLHAVNFADDLLNPAELGVLERAMPAVRHGTFTVLPPSPETQGHQTLAQAGVWSAELVAAMQGLNP